MPNPNAAAQNTSTSYICVMCGDNFVRFASLREHQKVHNLNPYTEHYQAKKDALICAECGSKFRYESELFKHRQIHTGKRDTPEKYSDLKHLETQRDSARQSGERKFKCASCGKVLSTRAAYVNHVRIHTRKKYTNNHGNVKKI